MAAAPAFCSWSLVLVVFFLSCADSRRSRGIGIGSSYIIIICDVFIDEGDGVTTAGADEGLIREEAKKIRTAAMAANRSLLLITRDVFLLAINSLCDTIGETSGGCIFSSMANLRQRNGQTTSRVR